MRSGLPRIGVRIGAALALSGIALSALVTPSVARADDCSSVQGISPCIDLDNLWARPGGSPFFATGSTLTTPAGQVSAGTVVSYSRRPLRLSVPGTDLDPRDVFVVENMLDETFLLGVGITDRLEITLAAPVTFYQDGAGLGALSGSGDALPRSVVRDPRIGFALGIIERDRAARSSGFALVGRFDLGIPLGAGEAFAGTHDATFVPGVTAGYRIGPFEAAAEVSARIRGDVPLGADTWGTQLVTSLGVGVEVWAKARLFVGAEAFAAPVLASQSEGQSALVPSEWIASVRTAPFLSGDVYFQLGGGTSIPLTSFAATSPEVRGLFSVGYAPQALDSDHDGVLDRDDKCPAAREDRDGFEDDDGCPDPDNDGDRIPDSRDRCRDAAETYDGFKDDDGCPDLDDDGDGVPDEEDACRNEPEDKDGFQDDDGCPDPDNDKDGIPDAKDGCPTAAEDKDGFQDEDGCPDLDNDRDGVPDVKDRCPKEPEDKDGFQDEDGCPEPDNDGDGILDGADRCPNEAETIDGRDDDDGCPEPGAKSLVTVTPQGRVTFSSGAKFKPRSADLTPELERMIRVVAKLAKGQPSSVLVVEAYPDKPADSGGEQLAVRRAGAVRKLLVSEGVPERRITAASGDLTAKRPADAAQLELTFVRSTEP